MKIIQTTITGCVAPLPYWRVLSMTDEEIRQYNSKFLHEEVVEYEVDDALFREQSRVLVTDWEDVEQLTNVIPWCESCQNNHFPGQCDPDLDWMGG